MDYKMLFDTAVLAGELLIKNGAETYRVEDTMYRILNKSNLETIDVLVMMTGFVATLDDPEIEVLTMVRRIKSRGTNLDMIDKINVISRRFCQDMISLEDTYKQMLELKKSSREVKYKHLMMMTITGGFAIMLGGHPAEVVVAAIAGLVSSVVMDICRKFHLHMFLENILCCISLAVTVGIITGMINMDINKDLTIVSSIMPFVPGAAITNGVFDTLHGDYISGSARMAEAFVIASAVAIGIGLGLLII